MLCIQTFFHFTKVEPLQEDEVRWFYESKDNKGKVTKLKPMVGYDSLRVERAYRDLLQNVHAPTERLLIRGGLFEVRCFAVLSSL